MNSVSCTNQSLYWIFDSKVAKVQTKVHKLITTKNVTLLNWMLLSNVLTTLGFDCWVIV